MDFFLVWSTAPATFQPRFMRSVESICFHHPDARVSVLSNTLPDNFFEALVAEELRDKVHRGAAHERRVVRRQLLAPFVVHLCWCRSVV